VWDGKTLACWLQRAELTDTGHKGFPVDGALMGAGSRSPLASLQIRSEKPKWKLAFWRFK